MGRMAAVLLITLTFPALALAQTRPTPTAEELLERARHNQTVIEDPYSPGDSLAWTAERSRTTPARRRPNDYFGAGFTNWVALLEGTTMMNQARDKGMYFGIGAWLYRNEIAELWLNVSHLGFAMRLDDIWTGGIGVEYGRAEASIPDLDWSADERAAVVHLWIEAGQPGGWAIRGQHGLTGLGVSLHYGH